MLSATSALLGDEWDFSLDGHADLQRARPIVDGDLEPVHELRPILGGLYIARRELGFRGDEADGPWEARAAGIREHRRLLAEPQARHIRFADVDIRPDVVEIRDDN